MKPDCQNVKCGNHDVEYEGACDMHLHLRCSDYVAERPVRDRLASCEAATKYLNDRNNASANANKLRSIKQALADCHTQIAGDDLGTDAETRETVANRTLRRYLEELL